MKCIWSRSFDEHFVVSCNNITRASREFKPCEKIKNTKWDFIFCPFCGQKIKIIDMYKNGEKNEF
jgi:hypothetical protein